MIVYAGYLCQQYYTPLSSDGTEMILLLLCCWIPYAIPSVILWMALVLILSLKIGAKIEKNNVNGRESLKFIENKYPLSEATNFT